MPIDELACALALSRRCRLRPADRDVSRARRAAGLSYSAVGRAFGARPHHRRPCLPADRGAARRSGHRPPSVRARRTSAPTSRARCSRRRRCGHERRRNRRKSRRRAPATPQPAIDPFRGQHLALAQRQIATEHGRASVVSRRGGKPAGLAGAPARARRPCADRAASIAGRRTAARRFHARRI